MPRRVARDCRTRGWVPQGVPLPGLAPTGSAGDWRWQEAPSPSCV
jgi:hypothetical protein